mmetsp:Transcript_118388/g.334602  ORF Transcript_118388/g.334602 Transcript_118388/m.334602 type:complete len:836 (+) Transcript_118388:127-2634(+)
MPGGADALGRRRRHHAHAGPCPTFFAEIASTPSQRGVAAVLACANVVVLALTLQCLKLVGEKEAQDRTFMDIELNLADLYEEPSQSAIQLSPPLKKAPGVAALAPLPVLLPSAAEKLHTTATVALPQQSHDVQPERTTASQMPSLMHDGGTTAVPPCVRPAAASASSAKPLLPCELPALSLGGGGSGGGGRVRKVRCFECGACNGPIRGHLPTTLRVELEVADHDSQGDCTWQEYGGAFLYDVLDGYNNPSASNEARSLCLTMGAQCRGITCDAAGTKCTMRKGTTLHASEERTYVKTCPETRAEAGSTGSGHRHDAATPLDESMKNCNTCSAPSTARAASEAMALAGGSLVAHPAESVEHLRGTAIVVLAHNRASNLRSCLRSLFGLGDVSLFKIHVSVDGVDAFDRMEAEARQEAAKANASIDVWRCQPRQTDPMRHGPELLKWFETYNTAKIAWHYWSVFEKTFTELKYEFAIFVEDDLHLSPDFLAFFRSTAWLLKEDHSIWCVSAWNDNGFPSVSHDHCRLLRSTYFPGLGFLLPREAWLTFRTWWAQAPTMGWDYWMRVAFRRAGKECIIPEVPRSHHVSQKGASVSSAKSVELFKMMSFADLPSTCAATQPCRQFGDLGYLLEAEYEARLRRVIESAPRVSRLSDAPGHEALYVLPYKVEEYPSLAFEFGIRPRSHKNVIPMDVRAEHYGVWTGRHAHSGARVLAVDRRSMKEYFKDPEQLRPSESMVPTTSSANESCDAACAKRGLKCSVEQMHFLNTCTELMKAFPCEEGCAHQVGKELPVYVAGRSEPTFRQCLVTFISRMECSSKHASTMRLCACVPNVSPGTR